MQVVDFEQMLKLSMNLLIYPMVKTFSYRHYWPYIKIRLLKFLSFVEIIYRAVFSCKELTFDCFCFAFAFQKVYSQNDETGVLEVLEIKTFFAAQPW